MSIIYNGVDIKKLYHNGVEVKTAFHNGVEVFSSVPAGPEFGWSGSSEVTGHMYLGRDNYYTLGITPNGSEPLKLEVYWIRDFADPCPETCSRGQIWWDNATNKFVSNKQPTDYLDMFRAENYYSSIPDSGATCSGFIIGNNGLGFQPHHTSNRAPAVPSMPEGVPCGAVCGDAYPPAYWPPVYCNLVYDPIAKKFSGESLGYAVCTTQCPSAFSSMGLQIKIETNAEGAIRLVEVFSGSTGNWITLT